MDIHHLLVLCLSIGFSYSQRQTPHGGPRVVEKVAGSGRGASKTATKVQGRPGDIRPFRSMIVKLHNDYRRSEGGTAMKKLRWSKKLEREAYNHVNKCRYMHQYGSWGENLYKVESFLPDNVLIERALSTWYYEKLSWHPQPDCSEACHYTQMVWSSTTELGCAFKKCPILHLKEEFINNGWMLVCFYNPQGNVIGEFPYIQGRPCSECARGDFCDRGLCSSPAPAYRAPPPRPPPPRPARKRPPPPSQQEPRRTRPSKPPPPSYPPPSKPPAPVRRKPAPPVVHSPVVHSARPHQKSRPVFKAKIPPVDKKYDPPPQRPRPAPQDSHAPPPHDQHQPRQNPPPKPKPQPYQPPPPPKPTPAYQPQPQPKQEPYRPPAQPKQDPYPPQPQHRQDPYQPPAQPKPNIYQPPQRSAQQSSLGQPPPRPGLGVSPKQERILDLVANANGVFTTGDLRPAFKNNQPLRRQDTVPNSQDKVAGHLDGAHKTLGVSLGGPRLGVLSSLSQSHAGQLSQQNQDMSLMRPPPAQARPPPPPPPTRPPPPPTRPTTTTTTTTPPPPPPPAPPKVQSAGPRCPDKDQHCPDWKVYCDSNPYVHENCRYTCNTCNVPTPPRAFGIPESKASYRNPQTAATVKKATTTPPPQPTTTPTLYPPTRNPSEPPPAPQRRAQPRRNPTPRRNPPPRRQPQYSQPTQAPRYQPTQPLVYDPPSQAPYRSNTAPYYNNPSTYPPRSPTATPPYPNYSAGPNYNYNNNHYPGYNSAASVPSGVGGGPNFLCKDYDNRCGTWSKYCGLDEYVDDMCKKTCHRCFA